MYSQSDEEIHTNGLLPDKGRFLDIGAFDALTFSNTRKLHERGWTGVLLEPSPLAFAGAQRNTEGMEGITLIQKAIAEHSGEVEFYESGGDAISTTYVPHKEKWEEGYPNCKFTKITVKTISFNALFDEVGADFDMVNIDTESTNWEVLSTFPFARCLPKVMCIEFDDKKGQMEAMLAKHGYKTVYTSGENIVVYRA